MTDNMSHFLYHQNILVIYTIYTHTKKLTKYLCLYGDKSVFNASVGKRYFELKNDLNSYHLVVFQDFGFCLDTHKHYPQKVK